MQYINEAFRAMHTIKGAGGMYGFDAIVEVTHEMENLYDIVRNSQQATPQSLIDITFTICDHLRQLLADEELHKDTNIQQQMVILQDIKQISVETSTRCKGVRFMCLHYGGLLPGTFYSTRTIRLYNEL